MQSALYGYWVRSFYPFVYSLLTLQPPVMNALRAPATAHPPLNMHNALIFNACFIAATACLVVFFTGKQTRREMDEEMAKKATTS